MHSTKTRLPAFLSAPFNGKFLFVYNTRQGFNLCGKPRATVWQRSLPRKKKNTAARNYSSPMSRSLFSSGWPIPSESDGFIMINKFHFHRGKGTMSARTESGEASFQMLISKHALAWHYNLEARLLGKMWVWALLLRADMWGTSAAAPPRCWLSIARRDGGLSQGPQQTSTEWWENVLWLLCYYDWPVHMVTLHATYLWPKWTVQPGHDAP